MLDRLVEPGEHDGPDFLALSLERLPAVFNREVDELLRPRALHAELARGLGNREPADDAVHHLLGHFERLDRVADCGAGPGLGSDQRNPVPDERLPPTHGGGLAAATAGTVHPGRRP